MLLWRERESVQGIWTNLICIGKRSFDTHMPLMPVCFPPESVQEAPSRGTSLRAIQLPEAEIGESARHLPPYVPLLVCPCVPPYLPSFPYYFVPLTLLAGPVLSLSLSLFYLLVFFLPLCPSISSLLACLSSLPSFLFLLFCPFISHVLC